MAAPEQPFPSSAETMAAFARHLSAGKVVLYRSLGLELVMGRRDGIRFWDAYSGRSWINCHCNGGVNPTVEGAATAHYISEMAREYGVLVTRIAHGVPLGGELDYVDGGTLAHAFAGRHRVD